MQGSDPALINAVAPQVRVPIMACGGARGIEHLSDAIDRGATAVAAGSLFVFQGKHHAVLVTYPERNEPKNLFVCNSS